MIPMKKMGVGNTVEFDDVTFNMPADNGRTNVSLLKIRQAPMQFITVRNKADVVLFLCPGVSPFQPAGEGGREGSMLPAEISNTML